MSLGFLVLDRWKHQQRRYNFGGPKETVVFDSLLDLGKVEIISLVRLNGTDCGILETWPEWFINNEPQPSGRYPFTSSRHYKNTSTLSSSGLLGPVKLMFINKKLCKVEHIKKHNRTKR